MTENPLISGGSTLSVNDMFPGSGTIRSFREEVLSSGAAGCIKDLLEQKSSSANGNAGSQSCELQVLGKTVTTGRGTSEEEQCSTLALLV